MLNFVTGSLRPIKSETDDTLSTWYKAHSHVFVADDHACWINPDSLKKIRKKRFGTVLRSPVKGLNAMMKMHFDEATSWVAEMTGGDEEQDEKYGGGEGASGQAGVLLGDAML